MVACGDYLLRCEYYTLFCISFVLERDLERGPCAASWRSASGWRGILAVALRSDGIDPVASAGNESRDGSSFPPVGAARNLVVLNDRHAGQVRRWRLPREGDCPRVFDDDSVIHRCALGGDHRHRVNPSGDFCPRGAACDEQVFTEHHHRTSSVWRIADYCSGREQASCFLAAAAGLSNQLRAVGLDQPPAGGWNPFERGVHRIGALVASCNRRPCWALDRDAARVDLPPDVSRGDKRCADGQDDHPDERL